MAQWQPEPGRRRSLPRDALQRSGVGEARGRALSRRAVTQAETQEEEVRDQGPDHSRGTLPTGHLERSQPNSVPRQDTRKKPSSPAKAPSWALSRGSQGREERGCTGWGRRAQRSTQKRPSTFPGEMNPRSLNSAAVN